MQRLSRIRWRIFSHTQAAIVLAAPWDNNLRLQGYREAFTGKCILG